MYSTCKISKVCCLSKTSWNGHQEQGSLISVENGVGKIPGIFQQPVPTSTGLIQVYRCDGILQGNAQKGLCIDVERKTSECTTLTGQKQSEAKRWADGTSSQPSMQ